MAPEIVMCASGAADGYSFPCDIWSAGCVVFAIVTAQPHGPFHIMARRPGEGGHGGKKGGMAGLFECILAGKLPLDIVEDYLARDLLTNLLAIRPENRYTAIDALTHPWLIHDDEADASGDLSSTEAYPSGAPAGADAAAEVADEVAVEAAAHASPPGARGRAGGIRRLGGGTSRRGGGRCRRRRRVAVGRRPRWPS